VGSGADTDLIQALERARAAVAEQDRKLLHLKTLYDTSRELTRLADPARVLETFLLMVMGPLGVRQGFAQLFVLTGGPPEFAARGLDPAVTQALRQGQEHICEALFGATCENVPGRVDVLASGLEAYPFLPPGTTTLVRWCGPEEYAGLLGLGPPLSGQPRGPADLEFLSRLAGILIAALDHAVAMRTVQRLYRDLAARNEELDRAVGRAESMQRELDRRMFQLHSLYEAGRELAGIVETRGLLDAFLLTVMGVFGTREAGVYLHSAAPVLVVRGTGSTEVDEQAQEACRRTLAAAFEAALGAQDGEAMHVTVLTGEKQLAGAAFPFPARVAVAFSVGTRARGLMALGARLDGEPYRMADHNLLKAHVANVLSYVNNALSFDEITALNASLVRRNEELNRLLSEISACRVELSDVERARERILAVIRRETSRSGRVRRMDFALILLLALVIGLAFNFSNPAGVALVPAAWTREPLPTIDAQWLRLKTEGGATLVVDARPVEMFRRAHVRGAVNLPRSLFDFVYAMRLANLDPATRIVVYGRTVSSRYDEDVAAMLRNRGFASVAVLAGGLEAWQARGYPVEHGP